MRGGGGLLSALALAALLIGVLTLNFTADRQSADALTVTSNARYLSLDAGGERNCSLRANGTIACWGSNSSGQVPTEDVTP